MKFNIPTALLFLIGAVSAHPTGTYCVDLVIPVHVNAPTYPPIFPPLKSGYEAVAFLLEATKRGSNPDTTVLLGKPVNISTTFQIAATYCAPKGFDSKKGVVQLLSHGLGFDRGYWNLDGANNYKDAATAAGYATLFYDRLGNGHSTIADPYTTVQVPVEVAVLVELTKLLRSGKISPKVPAASRVVHVGHSYGSQLSNALIASAPELSDGAVFTGYSTNATWQLWFQISTAWHLASENQPARFGNHSSGYLTWGDKYYNQYSFLKYPYFDPAILVAGEAAKQPFTLGELITFPLAPVKAPKFAKPVMLMAADSDLIFCGADCHGVVDGPYAKGPEWFSAAKPFKTYIQPNSGHGMNLHLNATGWYDVVFKFLGSNGL